MVNQAKCALEAYMWPLGTSDKSLRLSISTPGEYQMSVSPPSAGECQAVVALLGLWDFPNTGVALDQLRRIGQMLGKMSQ